MKINVNGESQKWPVSCQAPEDKVEVSGIEIELKEENLSSGNSGDGRRAGFQTNLTSFIERNFEKSQLARSSRNYN